jgi:predicted GNAT superfamily acetyltransferase
MGALPLFPTEEGPGDNHPTPPAGSYAVSYLYTAVNSVVIRDVVSSDFNSVLSLNESEVHNTSPMDWGRLQFLDSISWYHKAAVVDGIVAGFLLVMKDDCDYVNDNFQWFSSRYDSFLYIDRIVIAPDHRSLKLGTLLYTGLFDHARSMNIKNIVCEYNVIPPNDASRLFHDKFSFSQVGTQWLNGGSKKVSLQLARV